METCAYMTGIVVLHNLFYSSLWLYMYTVWMHGDAWWLFVGPLLFSQHLTLNLNQRHYNCHEHGINMWCFGSCTSTRPAKSPSQHVPKVGSPLFQAKNIMEGKQVAILLSKVGATTHALLRDLLAPQKPQEKSLWDLFAALKTHFEPKPLVI